MVKLNKYVIIGISVIVALIIAWIAGWGYGRANVQIVHDTTQVIDTIVQTDTCYKMGKIDTVVIDTTHYIASTSYYGMNRNGYAQVWFIRKINDPAGAFKWKVREPDPLVVTNIKYREVRVPSIDWRLTTVVGVVGLVAGFIGGIKFR